MEKKIGQFEYESTFSRNKLTRKITSLIDSNYSVGLHAIGYTKKDKIEVASKISEEGIKVPQQFSAYYTIRFFGYPYRDNRMINEYSYDTTNHHEVAIVVAIPNKFAHSSGKIIEGGEFPYMSSSTAKRELNEFRKFKNLSDNVFKPIPKEFILGCYTFDSKERTDIPETIRIPVDDGYGHIDYRYEIDPCAKTILGPCDFYINPGHYRFLSQEEKDEFIEKHFWISFLRYKSTKTNPTEPSKVYTRRKIPPIE